MARASARKPVRQQGPTLSDLEIEAEWRTCRGSDPYDVDACLYFLRKYWYIQHPAHGSILFDTVDEKRNLQGIRPAQVETLRAWLSDQGTISLKARQIGYTTLSAGMMFWETFFWPDIHEVSLSRTGNDAQKVLRKVKHGYRKLPKWLKDRGPQPQSTVAGFPGTQTFIEWNHWSSDDEESTTSSIESLPSSENPARGGSYYRIIGDEMAYWDNPEDAWAAIEGAVEEGGRFNGFSTAYGENFFFTMWNGANGGKGPGSSLKPMFYGWWAHTGRDDQWFAQKGDTMAPWQRAQEAPATPEEAFRVSSNARFDLEAVSKQEVVPPEIRGIITGPTPQVTAMDHGPYRQWGFPSPSRKYALGADVAEGLEFGDYSTVHVLDVTTREVVAAYESHVDPEEFGNILGLIGKYWNNALAGVEENNHGLVTLKALQRLRYPNIYYRRRLGTRTQDHAPTNKLGWRTTTVTKPLMIEHLDKSLREGSVVVNDEPTVVQLRQYRIKYNQAGTPRTEGQPFDDLVMSLSLALQMVEHQANPQHEPTEKVQPYTLEWFEKRMTKIPTGTHFVGGRNFRRKLSA